MPAGDRKEVENSFDAEGGEHVFHVKHSLSSFSQNALNSFPNAYLFLHIKKVKTIVLNKHNEKED